LSFSRWYLLSKCAVLSSRCRILISLWSVLSLLTPTGEALETSSLVHCIAICLLLIASLNISTRSCPRILWPHFSDPLRSLHYTANLFKLVSSVSSLDYICLLFPCDARCFIGHFQIAAVVFTIAHWNFGSDSSY
jgi:hypothetical protein